METDWAAHHLELLRTFKNSPADLDANRTGRLGPSQERRLRRQAVNAILLMLVVVAVFVLIIAYVATKPISVWRWVLIAVVAVAGLAVGVRRGTVLRRSVHSGVVECFTDSVSVTMRGRAGWYLAVNGHSFHLPVRFWHVGSGVVYHVYVAPAAALIVAMEPRLPDSGP